MLGAAALSMLRSQIEGFVLAGLATWRVTHLLWAEDGPFGVLGRLRARLAAGGIRVFDCFYCLSLWVGAIAALLLGGSLADWLIDALALSAAAIVLERLTAGAKAAAWHDDDDAST